jgi:hypothetical protein
MRRSTRGIVLALGSVGFAAVAALPACSGTNTTSFGPVDGGGGGDGTSGGGGPNGSGSGAGRLSSTGSGTGSGGGSMTQPACPTGLTCDVACTGGATTTITGKVYDPAGKVGIYGVAVYVPAAPLVPLPKGVPTGNDACSCGALFQSGAIVNTTTGEDGSFTLSNVPVGSSVPLVLQVGKWRRSLSVNVKACSDNAQADGMLTLPGTIPAGDTDDNMPDIAVSTGAADSLECLLVRMGVSKSEYVPGTSTAGHVHIFSGGNPANEQNLGFGVTAGAPEETPMPNAPASPTALWSTYEQMMPFDVVLLSCEGGETYNAVPTSLEKYLDLGGRAFASHYHYAWFAGPLDTQQGYSPPGDWGTNLATWTSGENSIQTAANDIGATVNQTLNVGGGPFPKGVILDKWLMDNQALGTDQVPPTELAIWQPRFNAMVTSQNPPSQPWLTADQASGAGGMTMYFSFDTPVGAAIPPGGTTPNYCGRAVFSDLHVSGNTDNCNGGNQEGLEPSCDDPTRPPPASCDDVDLSPQEKVLEFMLFDLSSCVVSDAATISEDASLPPPPQSK